MNEKITSKYNLKVKKSFIINIIYNSLYNSYDFYSNNFINQLAIEYFLFSFIILEASENSYFFILIIYIKQKVALLDIRVQQLINILLSF